MNYQTLADRGWPSHHNTFVGGEVAGELARSIERQVDKLLIGMMPFQPAFDLGRLR